MKEHNLKNIGHSINFRKIAKPAVLCFIAIFMISTLSFFATTSVQGATVISFGNTAIGTNSAHNDANAQSVSYFKCSTTGSVTDIMAYIDGASSGKAIAAVYTVKGSSAGALLGQSNAISIGTTFSWIDFKLSSAVPVTSGTTYGLAIMGSVSINVKEVSGSGQRDHNAGGSFTNGFANPFGSIWGTDFNGAMSIYAIDPTTPTATPTSTPTSTTTSNPTTTPKPTISPTPTPTTSTSNKVPFPSAWTTATNGMHLGIGGVADDVLDKSVLYNGAATVRQDPVGSTDNTAREVDGAWLTIQPGQHIVFSCWIKTSASSHGDTNPNSGARIGIDFYGASGRITGTQSPDGSVWTPSGNWPSNTYLNYVHWGTSTWTLITMDFKVPTTVCSDGYSSYSAGTMVKPTAIIPWMQVWSSTYGANDAGQAWFGSPQLTIS